MFIQVANLPFSLDREFLSLIDANAKQFRITRSACIKSVLSQALDA